VMTENRNGFVVEAELRQVSGAVEREYARATGSRWGRKGTVQGARELAVARFLPMPAASMRRIGPPPLPIDIAAELGWSRAWSTNQAAKFIAFRRSVASPHRGALAASLLVCCPMALHRPVRHADATPAASLLTS